MSVAGVTLEAGKTALLRAVLSRRKSSRLGLGIQASYLERMSACMAGGDCPTWFSSRGKAAAWDAALKAAGSRFVWTDPAGKIKGITAPSRKDKNRVRGAIAKLEMICTTRRKDRDGDIMEPMGATVDPGCPLLWQHLTMEPIGKFFGPTQQTEQFYGGEAYIADTQLGRDAAVLAEMGALRVSQGFDPTKWEPISVMKLAGKSPASGVAGVGWHVLEYEVFEMSLVSVPACTDAVVTTFSRQKLHHPLVKQWAGALYESRPTVSRTGIDLSARQDGGGASVQSGASQQPNKRVTRAESPNGNVAMESDALTRGSDGVVMDGKGRAAAGKNKAGQPAGKSVSGSDITGSIDWIERRLRDSALAYMVGIGRAPASGCCGCYLLCMFPEGTAIVCVCDYRNDKQTLYQLAWSLADGEPVWTGQPAEVEIETTIVPAEGSASAVDGGVLLSESDAVCNGMTAATEVAGTKSGAACGCQKHGDLAVSNKATIAASTAPAVIEGLVKSLGVKAGRSISKANAEKLQDAHDLVGDALTHKDCHKSIKPGLKEAKACIKAVVDTVTPNDADGAAEPDDDDLGKKQLAARKVVLDEIIECPAADFGHVKQFVEGLVVLSSQRQEAIAVAAADAELESLAAEL